MANDKAKTSLEREINRKLDALRAVAKGLIVYNQQKALVRGKNARALKGYDVLGFKDEEPNHIEGCSYRRFFGPMVSSARFTRAEWKAWEKRSQRVHYFCANRRIVTEAVEKGEIEEAFIAEDGKPYKIGL